MPRNQEKNKFNEENAHNFRLYIQKGRYKKVMIGQCQHLNPSKRESLLNILNKFEYFFDVIYARGIPPQGTWN